VLENGPVHMKALALAYNHRLSFVKVPSSKVYNRGKIFKLNRTGSRDRFQIFGKKEKYHV
jgi:hypothetical protein